MFPYALHPYHFSDVIIYHFQIFILNAFLLYISYSLSLSFKCTEVYRLCSQGKLTKKQRVTVSAVLGDNVWLLGIICLQNAQVC